MMEERINKLNMVNVRLVSGYQVLSNKSITSKEVLSQVIRENFGDLDREIAIAVNLNVKGQPVNMNVISLGELSSTAMHPREVFKTSILSNAAALILYHNHPSGNIKPSAEDIQTTIRLRNAGEILGIKVLDHIIVGAGNKEIYSLTEHGDLDGTIRYDATDFIVGESKADWKANAKDKENHIKQMMVDIGENYKRNPEDLAEFFKFAEGFYKYSPRNTMLIREQNQSAVFCKSYADWKKEGISVKKGEKGLNIMVPVMTTFLKLSNGEEVKLSEASSEQKKLYKGRMIESRTRLNYKVGTVFDIAQTTYPKEDYPKIIGLGHSSKEHSQIYEGLKKYSEEKRKCSVEETSLGAALLKGRYFPTLNKIEINELLEDTAKVSTLSHELGHALLHNEQAVRNLSTARIEFEADAVSIMLQSKYGVPMLESRKEHLAQHYNDLKKELEGENKLTLDAIVASVYKTYRENIDDIDKFVEESLSKDELHAELKAGNIPYSYAVITNRGLDIEKRNEIETISEAVEQVLDNKNLPTVLNIKTSSGECCIYDSNFGVLIKSDEDYKLLTDTLPELKDKTRIENDVKCIDYCLSHKSSEQMARLVSDMRNESCREADISMAMHGAKAAGVRVKSDNSYLEL